MTLDELTVATRIHDWAENYSSRVLMERLDLIKALMTLPAWRLAEIIKPMNTERKGLVISSVQSFLMRFKEKDTI